jgi:HEPN domain-containing protein
MREEVRWWIESAYRELEKAEKNIEFKYFEETVFHCHQAIEKLFKGLSIHLKKERPIHSHNLVTLYNRIKMKLVLPRNLQDFLSEITPYYRITRYPNSAMGVPHELITKSIAKRFLKHTKSVFQCYQKLISEE